MLELNFKCIISSFFFITATVKFPLGTSGPREDSVVCVLFKVEIVK